MSVTAQDKLVTGSVNERTAVNALFAKGFSTPTFTVGAEAANAIITTVQLKDAVGVAVAAKTLCTVWLSDTAAAAVSGTPPSGAVSFTAGVQLKEVTTKVLHEIVTTAAGLFTVSITEAGAKSYFLNVAIGDVVASQQITWA